MIDRRHALGFLAALSLWPNRGFADVAPLRSEIRESLARHFLDDGTVGTFVGYKIDDYLIIASDKNRSGEAKLPASTFKIPNSLIALETGVVQDPDKDVFKWDGVTRPIEAWNKDHTLRSAIAASAVPVYQEIARRIGEARMQKYVDLLDYCNRDIGGGMGQALNAASAMDAYTLSDRGTWLSFNNKGSLIVAIEGDPRLINRYDVIELNPQKHGDTKIATAKVFADWLVSSEGQQAIGAYQVNGLKLFNPSAGSPK